jgi:hypothetical protein
MGLFCQYPDLLDRALARRHLRTARAKLGHLEN